MVSPLPKPASDSGRPTWQTIGQLHDDAPSICLHQSLLETIVDHARGDLQRESGGFLLGQFDQADRSYVELQHVLPAAGTRSRGASLTFTHDTWSALQRSRSQEFPDCQLVGWYHTHLNLGVFLSGYDTFIQRHFFPHWWQVALVVDPRRCEFGFFQWQRDQLVDCGFVYVPTPASGLTTSA